MNDKFFKKEQNNKIKIKNKENFFYTSICTYGEIDHNTRFLGHLYLRCHVGGYE